MSETNKLNQKQQAQLQNIFNMNKGVMKCQVDGHEQQRLKYLCLDQSCTLPNKLGCADCFLDSHNGHQNESTLVQFKQDLNLDIDRQFDDIKTQILQKFDSFKVDLKSHLNKKLSIKSESLSQLDQTLNNLKSLSESNFEQFSDTEVNQCIQFYFNNEEIKKGLEENQFLVTKVKQTAIKNKSKYFEKLKNLWADILSEHSGGQNQQNGDESSEDNQNGTPNSQQLHK
ncbi:hypothetical protein PPERSA_09580 [Pseudocohnilembus persalinus]|uniref:B box-type domain-containing protein n=1 Tax=Pseudocohnilembus persalinus TaxID=266149 RepID=A0A0V0QFJ5_PSEPJ|nr:hypothetical protein PPERSA_09580 [Pseudocohnilembus persalinus]|eukprot:KRX00974.1 hypothetical protein PPERSA_09580 [Pseudocohnilembus persalinus]